ncbi:hypothetical protein [Enterococcus malodoratus]|uniref:Uncharacterized protein n=1 Tax=Enterococcus malodoratus ATCC 43197 TaxID=1158601 RepID=R2QUY1_9ENTE|nr:hypothetical protein [Enterococcus malodoratus]BBM19910.1 hypothetical protein G15_3591 [Enterococcus avium]EOH72286.1 hypothetical protein UAI_03870 [Enterococcus malodoratus ATCC 43197]EOT70389.1 hypothetical protein I585_01869 [Enterococcus malodoratus ATCC 43197]OJG64194.1 hypothetical protein RV07_GL000339 [Enterococcus malodoratus]SET24452.1 hypothetical protein SAMN04487821_108125 [Enterococcus malodoratus]
MYEDIFAEVQLTVVEQPIEWVNDLPLYRGHIKELPFLVGEGPSKKAMYRQLAEQYQEYAALNQVEDKEEEMTSSLLTADQLLKYYDGETFDGFSLGDMLKDE